MSVSVADLAGRVLASRYRLMASIGAGGGGRVYVADDVRLRRRVAVKVLHPALADDAGFLRRFRSEAQLAASLHHPHVMAVYDWGEDGGVPFMVLELLAGGSLRSVLDRGTRLTAAQAAHLGRQVTSALDYAHARGLVHRDIKPANLLFDEHGIARVADFGLARALAEASWTEPAGAVVGTARYAAPEQASGAPLDGRADLYALSLVLVEAVTGRVPFASDTALGTLAARTQEPILAPDELGPLGRVVERAGRPLPDERYPDARAMGEAVSDAAERLPPPTPLTLAGLSPSVVDDPDPTQHRRTGALFDQDADDGPGAASDGDAATVAVEPVTVPRRGTGSSRAVPIVVGVAVALVVAIAVGLFLARPGGATVPAPSLVGLSREEAVTRASDAGVLLEFRERDSDDPQGVIVGQSPGAGEWLSEGGTVTVFVSRGPPPVPVPDVTGQAQGEAELVLAGAGFGVNVVTEHHEEVAEGLVLRTEPAANADAAPDSTVTLVVSAGPAPVPVPDVVGVTFEEAAAALAERRFGVQQADEFSDTVPAGVVVRTDPAAGVEAARDSTVTVVVSKGPELVAVPAVRGQTVEAASALLREVGLVPDVDNFEPGGRVRQQDPDPGTQLRRGEEVTLFL
ncbi:MAG TPA: PASTA domain-containing protein [Acidimicrobiia bacterium]